MNDLLISVLMVLALGAVLVSVWLSFASERKFYRELAAREPLKEDAFYETFYQEQDIDPDIPRRLRPIYANFFGMDPLKLRPHDCPPEIREISTAELLLEIEEEFGMAIADTDAEKISGSFDSIVQYLAAAKAGPGQQ